MPSLPTYSAVIKLSAVAASAEASTCLIRCAEAEYLCARNADVESADCGAVEVRSERSANMCVGCVVRSSKRKEVQEHEGTLTLLMLHARGCISRSAAVLVPSASGPLSTRVRACADPKIANAYSCHCASQLASAERILRRCTLLKGCHAHQQCLPARPGLSCQIHNGCTWSNATVQLQML